MINRVENWTDYVVQEIVDASKTGIAALARIQAECPLPASFMERFESSKACFLSIEKLIYEYSDLVSHEPHIGYYNVRDYLNEICAGMNRMIYQSFGIDLEFSERNNDDENLAFDGRMVERIVFNILFAIICNKPADEKQRVSVYAKNSAKYMIFCIKSGTNLDKRLGKDAIDDMTKGMYPLSAHTNNGLMEIAYSGNMSKKLGGAVKYCPQKSGDRFEIHIPKNLKIGDGVAKEQESAVRLGERVMVYRLSPPEEIMHIFTKLLG